MGGEARCEEMSIYWHIYVRDGVGNVIIEIRNVPFVSLFRSDDGSLRSRFSVFRVQMSSKDTSSDVTSDGIEAFLTIDDLDPPLDNIDRRALAVLIIQNMRKCLVLTI